MAAAYLGTESEQLCSIDSWICGNKGKIRKARDIKNSRIFLCRSGRGSFLAWKKDLEVFVFASQFDYAQL